MMRRSIKSLNYLCGVKFIETGVLTPDVRRTTLGRSHPGVLGTVSYVIEKYPEIGWKMSFTYDQKDEHVMRPAFDECSRILEGKIRYSTPKFRERNAQGAIIGIIKNVSLHTAHINCRVIYGAMGPQLRDILAAFQMEKSIPSIITDIFELLGTLISEQQKLSPDPQQ